MEEIKVREWKNGIEKQEYKNVQHQPHPTAQEQRENKLEFQDSFLLGHDAASLTDWSSDVAFPMPPRKLKHTQTRVFLGHVAVCNRHSVFHA